MVRRFRENWGADGTSILRGLIMAVEEVNARGGLLRRPLEYVTADTVDWTAEYQIAARDYLMEIPEAFNRLIGRTSKKMTPLPETNQEV